MQKENPYFMESVMLPFVCIIFLQYEHNKQNVV
jgi:hypothetical protein